MFRGRSFGFGLFRLQMSREEGAADASVVLLLPLAADSGGVWSSCSFRVLTLPVSRLLQLHLAVGSGAQQHGDALLRPHRRQLRPRVPLHVRRLAAHRRVLQPGGGRDALLPQLPVGSGPRRRPGPPSAHGPGPSGRQVRGRTRSRFSLSLGLVDRLVCSAGRGTEAARRTPAASPAAACPA